MNPMLGAVLNGAAQALLFALIVRSAGGRHRIGLHAAMLLLAAVLYLAFAAWGGSPIGLAVELAGVLAFGALAITGLRRRAPGLLALGWVVHVVWDLVLHSAGTLAGYTPAGWVAACVGFDLLLAALLVRGWAGAPAPAYPLPEGSRFVQRS